MAVPAAAQPAQPKPSPSATNVSQAKSLLKKGFKLATEWRTTKNSATLQKALGLFKRSFQLDGTLKAECNIGIAYRDLDKLAQAHLYLGNCINRLGAARPKMLASIRQLQSAVEAGLRKRGWLPLEVRSRPSGAQVAVDSFAKDEAFRAPRQIWLSQGEHKLSARIIGHVEKVTTVSMTAERSRKPLVIELSKAAKPTAEPKKPTPIVTRPKVDSPRRQVLYDTRPAPRGLLPAAVLGTGVAVIVAGGVMHAIAWGDRGDIADLGVGDDRERAISDYKSQRNVVVGLYAVGGLVAAAGLYLYKRKRGVIRVERPPSVSVVPLVDRGAVGAVLTFKGQM